MRTNLPVASPELRVLLGAELAFACSGAFGAMVPYFHMCAWGPARIAEALCALWVVLPYAVFGGAAVVGYRRRWSVTAGVARVVAAAVVAQLMAVAYVDAAFGRYHSATKVVGYLWFPLLAFLLGGVIFIVIAGCVWGVEAVAARWRRAA